MIYVNISSRLKAAWKKYHLLLLIILHFTNTRLNNTVLLPNQYISPENIRNKHKIIDIIFKNITDTFSVISMFVTMMTSSRMTLTCLLTSVVILSTLLVISSAKTQDLFYFDPSPINQDVVEGSGIELRCDVSNRKHIIFYWELNNKKVENSSRRFQVGSNLRILQVDRVEDAGGFRCIARNASTGVTLISTEAKLNIQCK